MKIEEFFKRININIPADCVHATYFEAEKEFYNRGVFFLEDSFIDGVNSIWGCLSNCCDVIKKAAALARNNDDVAFYSLFVYRAMLNREDFKKHLSEFVFPEGDTLEYDFLPMLVLIPVIPELYKTLQERGVPDDIIKATLCQFEDCIYIYSERYDKLGLNKHYFDHLQLYVDAQVLNIDRLRFEMIESLGSHIVVLKNKEDKLVVLFNGENINSNGMIKGTPHPEDDDNNFLACMEETKDYFAGHMVSADGRVEKNIKRFPKDEWEVVLKEGDSVLSVHIPARGALTEEICEASYERARAVFEKYYPDFKYKAFYCHTWLFDPQLKNFLSPNSNILMFQKKYTIFPGETQGRDVFNFVFKLKFKDYKDMPEETSLQRAIKKHYIDGKYIYEFEGLFL